MLAKLYTKEAPYEWLLVVGAVTRPDTHGPYFNLYFCQLVPQNQSLFEQLWTMAPKMTKDFNWPCSNQKKPA